jgi:translocation and assembly module TamB
VSRRSRTAWIAAGSGVGVLLLLVAAAVVVVRTDWFRNQVRERIVREVENATGGKVEIAAFRFDWRLLRATVEGFVIHGLEPAEAAPLFRARRIQVDLKLGSLFRRMVDLAALEVDEPRANVIVFPGGHTNLPEPKVKRQGGKNALQTVVDLAVRRYRVSNGLLAFESRAVRLGARGENLRALLSYDLSAKVYRGEFSTDPLYVDRPPAPPLPLRLRVPLVIGPQRIEVTGGRIETAQSAIGFEGLVENPVTAPRASWLLTGQLAAGDLDRAFALGLGAWTRHAPPLRVDVSAGLEDGRLSVPAARLSLGASRLETSGAVTNLRDPIGSLRLEMTLALNELGQWLAMAARPEGTARISGALDFHGSGSYLLRGRAALRDLSFRQGARRFGGISAGAAIEAGPRQVKLENLSIAAFGGAFTGNARVDNLRRFRVDGRLDQLEIRQVASAYGEQRQPWTGVVSGPLHAEGDLRSPGGKDLAVRVRLAISPRAGGLPVSGSIGATYDGGLGVLDLDRSYVALPHTRLDLSGSTAGQMQVRFRSTDLNDLLPVLALVSENPPRNLPVALRGGAATFSGTVSGTLDAPQVNGNVRVDKFLAEGQAFDRLAGELSVSPETLALRHAVLGHGKLAARFDAALALRNWKPQPDSVVAVRASLQDADLAELAMLAGRPPDGFTGTVNALVSLSGAFGNPRGTLDLLALKGTVFGEPFDRIQGKAQYADHSLNVPALVLESGAARLETSLNYQHAAGDLWDGRLQFRAASNRIRLDQFPVLQQRWPGLSGSLEFAADGAAASRRMPGGPQARFTSLNGKLTARGVQLNAQPFGDLTLMAATRGRVVSFQLASDFAKSAIHGDGEWRLADDYPVDFRLAFSRVWLSSVREWLAAGKPAAGYDALAEGRLTVSGSVFQLENLKGALEVTRVEAGPALPGPTRGLSRVALRNDGAIVLALDRSVIRLGRARLTGPGTEFAASGAISLRQRNPLDLRITGKSGLNLIQDFYPDVFAAGEVALNASIRGSLANPQISGRMDLKDASLNLAEVPNGISNANGTILFDGSQATIEKLSGESGGGKLAITGFVGYGGPETVFRLQAKAAGVRIRYPEGVSTTASADVTLTGTTNRSTLAGTVTIVRTGFNPRSDLGSILAQTTEPVRTPAAKGGFLDGMRLDVRIETAPNVQFETALARDIQGEANLRLRGTASAPALLGRVTITQGELNFFGTKYTIQEGSIAFYNPVKIEPVLNIDLETEARGVTVIMNVSGPISRLNLTPRSDPPLQFSEIIALLATGRTPTSDPTLLARQSTQQQTWQQMGASALLGEAIANPVSGRLQRLFGVSRLKIDPSFSGVENNPQARLTLEQQITRDITFTYITNLSRSNYQVVRVEWALNKNWSVIALREENGLFGLDFLYKKRFQ